MIKVGAYYLTLNPIKISVSLQSKIKEIIVSGGRLKDIDAHLNLGSFPDPQVDGEVSCLSFNLDCSSVVKENKVDIIDLGTQTGALMVTPLSAYIYLKKFHIYCGSRKSINVEKINRIKRKIREIGEMPMLVGVLPSDIVHVDNGRVLIKDSETSLNFGTLVKRVTLSESNFPFKTQEVLLNAMFDKQSGSMDSLIREAINDVVLGSHELPDAFLDINEGFMELNNKSYNIINLTDSQIQLIRSANNYGLTYATLSYMLNEIGESKDTGGHMNCIEKYVNAFNLIRGKNSSYDTLTDDIDLSIGGSVCDSLIPGGGNATGMYKAINALANFVPNRNHILFNTKSKSLVGSINRSKLKRPMTLLGSNKASYSSGGSNILNVTFEGVEYTMESEKSSLFPAIKDLIDADPIELTAYIDDMMGILDAIHYVKQGGELVVMEDRNNILIRTSNASLALYTRAFVKTINSKLTRLKQ